MADATRQDGEAHIAAYAERKLSRATLLARQRIANPVDIDFGALLKGTPTGGAAQLCLEATASAAVEALLRPVKTERRTEQPLDDLKFNIIARGPFDFLFDEEDRMVMVSYGTPSSDDLPALTEQAMSAAYLNAPSQTDGIRLLWDERPFSEFVSLSRFAGVFSKTYPVQLTNGRTVDRWLKFEIETSHARLYLDFLHKIVPQENHGYSIDYALSAMTVVSRRHLERLAQL